MLLEFKTKNYKSFVDEARFSMVAAPKQSGLEDKITIREAFLNGEKAKLLIEYDGKEVCFDFVAKEQIPHELLPTTGEYMNAEDDEFLEEITYFKKKAS